MLQVSAGGVDVGAVDARTMPVAPHSGVYVCGELLDVTRPCGGYNLQLAFCARRPWRDLRGEMVADCRVQELQAD